MNEMQCKVCREKKDVNDFAWRRKGKGLRDIYCKACRKAYHRDHYLRNKARYLENARARTRRIHHLRTEWLIMYLREHPCVDCGETDPVVLEFDHVEGKKEFNVGAGFRGDWSFERVVREINKCEVVCANCHRRRTSKRGGFLKGLLLAQDAKTLDLGAGEENRTPVIRLEI